MARQNKQVQARNGRTSGVYRTCNTYGVDGVGVCIDVTLRKDGIATFMSKPE